LYDPASVSELSTRLEKAKRFRVFKYDDLDKAKSDLQESKIIALANVSQDPLEDTVQILTEGHNPMIDNQIAMGLLAALTAKSSSLSLPIHTETIFPCNISLRDFVTPGFAAYLCYVLASMNVGFSWIYEWMEKTYRQIILAPDGLQAVIVAKTLIVTAESSLVLWLALAISSLTVGFTLGNNLLGLASFSLLSTFCFTCLGLAAACVLRTIRIYTMTVSIFGVALMFASGMIIPAEAMPAWEQVCARFFPMYYAADAFRGTMLNLPAHYNRDIMVLLIWAAIGLMLSTISLHNRKAQL
jgi:hypothetical protein